MLQAGREVVRHRKTRMFTVSIVSGNLATIRSGDMITYLPTNLLVKKLEVGNRVARVEILAKNDIGQTEERGMMWKMI
jgi:hypothetical protein